MGEGSGAIKAFTIVKHGRGYTSEFKPSPIISYAEGDPFKDQGGMEFRWRLWFRV
jgi:hypothetical protein